MILGLDSKTPGKFRLVLKVVLWTDKTGSRQWREDDGSQIQGVQEANREVVQGMIAPYLRIPAAIKELLQQMPDNIEALFEEKHLWC